MKVISYSLFNANDGFEFKAMLRGFYWNYRMNSLIYPDFTTVLNVDQITSDKYKKMLMVDMPVGGGFKLVVNEKTAPLCEAMLWRIKPIFDRDVTHVICRDADALTTYREAQAVHVWTQTNYPIHAILDNPAHHGLMGGMIGLTKEAIKEYKTFDEFVGGYDLSKRGSDQDLLNLRLSKRKPILWNKGTDVYKPLEDTQLPGVDPKLWESNLTCRHIGSAGVVEMETIRFFKRFDNNKRWDDFEKKYPEIFYWHA